jgi:hypothetical protein
MYTLDSEQTALAGSIDARQPCCPKGLRTAPGSRRVVAAVTAVLLLTTGGAFANGPHKSPRISFDMVVSKGAAACLPHAEAEVKVISNGTAEDMFVFATGLPPKTNFDFFVIQVPQAPFGLAWYQGDVQTDDDGNAFQHFRGRFSIETFIVAPGIAPAPQIFNDSPFPEAAQNPATEPVQTYHLGLWFNSPEDARKAKCPTTETPFNGEHNAGIQVLNTANFPNTAGPLLKLKP